MKDMIINECPGLECKFKATFTFTKHVHIVFS